MGPMLPASGQFRPSSGTLLHIYSECITEILFIHGMQIFYQMLQEYLPDGLICRRLFHRLSFTLHVYFHQQKTIYDILIVSHRYVPMLMKSICMYCITAVGQLSFREWLEWLDAIRHPPLPEAIWPFSSLQFRYKCSIYQYQACNWMLHVQNYSYVSQGPMS